MTPTQTQDFVLLAELGEHGFLLDSNADYHSLCQRCVEIFDWLGRVGEGQFRQWLQQQQFLQYYHVPNDAEIVEAGFVRSNGLRTVAVLSVAKNTCLKTLVLERRQAMLRLHPRPGCLPNPAFASAFGCEQGFSAN